MTSSAFWLPERSTSALASPTIAQVVLPLHRVGEGGAHQQVDHVADEQKRAVLDVPVAVENHPYRMSPG